MKGKIHAVKESGRTLNVSIKPVSDPILEADALRWLIEQAKAYQNEKGELAPDKVA